jgi:hypothetical protein
MFDHFPVDSTSHLHTLYCKRFMRLRVLIKTHNTCNPSGRLSSPSGRRPVIDQLQIFFPSSNKGRLMQPSGQHGFPSERAHSSGKNRNSNTTVRTSVSMVRTRVQQIWKLRIQLQPSRRLPIIVRVRAKQIWKLRVEDQPSGRPSPLVQTGKALYGNYFQRTCDHPNDNALPSGRGSQTGKIFSENLEIFCRTVVRAYGPCSPSGQRPYLSQQSPI